MKFLCAAILFRKAQAQQADFGGLLIEQARKSARLIPFMGVGLDLLLDEAAHYLAISFVFGGIEWAGHSSRSCDAFVVIAWDVPKPHIQLASTG